MKLDGQVTPVALTGVGQPAATWASAKDVPVVAAWKIGQGRAVSLGVDRLAANGRIGLAGNGPFLARLALTLGKKHVFDEFHSGFGDGSVTSLLARVPYRWGVAQLALVGLLGLFAFSRRRVPADPPPRFRRRRTLDHVEAVAHLWQQARDAGLPLQAILNAVDERAQARLAGSGGARPFVEWIERMRPKLAARAREAWAKAESLAQRPRPSPDEARRAAVEIKQLEREASKW
jgi:hypothetical protein